MSYILVAAAYSVVNPLFESPDEFLHYEFVRYLLDQRSLPVQIPGKLTEFHQPPLYYALTALVIGGISVEPFTPVDNPFWGYDAYRFGVDNKARFIHTNAEAFPYQGTALAVHVARGLSIVLGALSVLVGYLILCEIFSRSRLALGALAFMAFNPQFLFISSSISNDNLITLLGLSLLWLSIRVARYGLTWRRMLFIAVLLAAAILTKLSAAILGSVPLLIVIFSNSTYRKRVAMLLTLGAVIGVITGWWFLRNYQLYDDWTGIRTWQQIWGWQTRTVQWSDIGIVLHNTWTSFWGQFGLGQIVLPDALYAALLALNVLCVLGLIWYVLRLPANMALSSTLRRQIRWKSALIAGCLLVAMLAASVWYGLANPTGAAGRFLLPAAAAIAGLLFWGLRNLYQPDRSDMDRWYIGFSYGLMLALSVGVLWGVIRPAYAAPDSTTLEVVQAQTRPIDIRFDDVARLVGFNLDRDRLSPGEELHVTLCWQTLRPTTTNVYFFLHLLGANDSISARRESLPGLGRYPSTQWAPAQFFCDNVPLRVDNAAVGATVYDLEIGLVDLSDGRRLSPSTAAGIELRPALLARVKVHNRQPASIAIQTGAKELGGQICLGGSEVTPSSAKAGDTLMVTLSWQAVQVPSADYTVFVHMCDASGQIMAQADSPPQQGAYPTSFWDAYETVIDPHTLSLPQGLPAGDYAVVVGLYRLDTGERLLITQGGTGSEIVLPQSVHVH